MSNKPEIGATIPDDTGAELRCVALQWPIGAEYDTLLRSVLYMLTRGRFWARETGSIRDAQSMGWRVFDANYPLMACGDSGTSDNGDSGDSDAGSFEDIFAASGGLGWTEGDEMPCIDLTGLIRIQNGTLQVRNSCCEWVTVGAMDSPIDEIPSDIIGGLLPEEQQYSACGRAYAVADAIFRVVDAVWDNKYSLPWNTIHDVESDAGMNLTGSNVLLCQSQAVLADSLFDSADVSDVTQRQKFLCKLAAQFEATGDKLSAAEWDAVKAACTGFTGVTGLFINNLYLDVAVLAIGSSRLSAIAQTGAVNDAQDCECPSEPGAIPDVPAAGLAWLYDFDFAANGEMDWDPTEANVTFVEGAGWESSHNPYDYLCGLERLPDVASTATFLRIYYNCVVNCGSFTGGEGNTSNYDNIRCGANKFGKSHVVPSQAYIDVIGSCAIGSGTLVRIMPGYQWGGTGIGIRFSRILLGGTGNGPFSEVPNLLA